MIFRKPHWMRLEGNGHSPITPNDPPFNKKMNTMNRRTVHRMAARLTRLVPIQKASLCSMATAVSLCRNGALTFQNPRRTIDSRVLPRKSKAIVQGSICYFGKYTVDEAAKTLTFHIRNGLSLSERTSWPSMA
jgi:hypothetical protein